MSAIPESFLKKTASVSEAVTRPFPNSNKIYVEGSRPDLRVPMREVTQAPTHTSTGIEENPPITIYDTSGPYSDPEQTINLMQGLAPLRQQWITERHDTELLDGPSSVYGRERLNDPDTAHLRFEHIRRPRRALPGNNVTQMHYARRGVITPEMEYVAIRENNRLQELRNDPRYTK
jgi:phosphomethylpyrimidine synthase